MSEAAVTYAVVKASGSQVKVAAGDTIRLDRVPGEPGGTLELKDVLLLAADGKVEIGRPTVAGAKVTVEIVRHARGKKIRVYKYKKKKGYQRTLGHRSEFTFVKVTGISR